VRANRPRTAVLVALALVLGIGRARAEPDRGRERAAERHFRAGAKAYAAQSFAAAAANFEEAYKVLPLPEIAFSAAQAYRRLYRIDRQPQHVRRAVELYRAYLDQVKIGGRVGDASDNLAEMERELDRLEALGARTRMTATPQTRLGVSVSLASPGLAREAHQVGALAEIADVTGELFEGVTVQLDGQRIEPFALVEVAPGDHVIAVTAEGYLPVEKRQRAIDGVSSLVEVELVPRPARVAIRTERGARISIDGRVAAGPTLELPAGTHRLAITRRGRLAWSHELDVGRGDELVLDAPLVKTARRRAVPWVLGGAGVLAFGAAGSTIGAVIADGRASELQARLAAGNAPPSDGDAYDRERDRRDRFRTSALVLGGAALIAGVAGGALYWFDTPPTHVAPVVGPGTVGVSAVGRF
jgi:hypothetical protein